MELLKPKKLKLGDTIGICTPSTPAYKFSEEVFQLACQNIERHGFKVKLGTLTEQRASQGYRSGSPQDRALEFMGLVLDDDVDAIMSTIGGMNSSSLIPYLDFQKIREKRKIFCGYSDVTSLHLAILKYAGLKTLYGIGFMPKFGEYPEGEIESINSFIEATTQTNTHSRFLKPFTQWSNHQRDWRTDAWKVMSREWKPNEGWKTLNSGRVEGEIVVANLNTMMSSAGTSYFPELKDKILLIEDMLAPWSRTERSFRQLQIMGVFDEISGLVWGKPESPNPEGADFSLDDLLLEVVGQRNYPIVSNFDCSHTVPMHTIGERSKVKLVAKGNYDVAFECLESSVE